MKEECKSKTDDTLDKYIVHNRFTNVKASFLETLKHYLETVSGHRPELRPVVSPSLPLFRRERFSFYSTEIFGRPLCLAIEKESWDVASPSEYEKQLQGLSPHFEAQPVFVFPTLPSNTRNRLVKKGIPFIVPGTQIFLPPALIDLRERFPRPAGKGRDVLTPTAQLTVLYHINRESLEGISLRGVAGKLHCSAMMASNVKDELEETGICAVERVGRSMTLHFPKDRRAFWESVKDRLVSPVKKSRWVRWTREPGYPALLSGISALSRRTMLADDRLPTYAFGPKMLESYLEQGILIGCRDSDEATAKMEVWSYEPKLLGDNETVDPLSLYLSLRYNADERVQQQLERLIEGIKW